MANPRVRVLVVDDSTYQRSSIVKNLGEDQEIEIIGMAFDGLDALDKVQQLHPDVITLDVEMPRMNGIQALERIMVEHPTPVVMLSTLTSEGAEETIKALELGAVDFFMKSSVVNPTGSAQQSNELCEKVKLASKVTRSNLRRQITACPPHTKKSGTSSTVSVRKIVVIGCSTGGPQALSDVLSYLPSDLPAPLLVVQHMPAGLTTYLAKRLNAICAIDVKEACDGDLMKAGEALLAPGDYHLVVNKNSRVKLDLGPEEWGLRPAVNVTMESVAKSFGHHVLCVIMTGMGSDGTRGAGAVKASGGKIFVEHESTCVVYGMPKSIVEAGAADKNFHLLILSQRFKGT